jgi:alpha-glucosidase (family GH31 glycosyl hydrolase)
VVKQFSIPVQAVGENLVAVLYTPANNKHVIFITLFLSVTFEDQYLQIGTQLPSNPNIYGLGEHVCPLRLTSGQTYTMWNFDTATPVNLNLYGSHPFYLDLRSSGLAHGVFLRNSNGMDVSLNDQSLSYKVIGGILDFYFFLGPQPEAVIEQYQEVIGHPALPPYWALGFHQSRYGYPNVETLEAVVGNYSSNKLPLDTMWTDIDYMDQYKDFTLDPNNFAEDKMQQFVANLHSDGQHYVVITDPGIKNENGYKPYDDGVNAGVFIRDKNNNFFVGKVWPGNTVFPDFFHPGVALQQYCVIILFVACIYVLVLQLQISTGKIR